MLKPPEPYMGRRGSALAPDPNFVDNSRRRSPYMGRRGSYLAPDPNFVDNTRRRGSRIIGINADMPNLGRRGSSMVPNMDPMGMGAGKRRGSILDGAREIVNKMNFKK